MTAVIDPHVEDWMPILERVVATLAEGVIAVDRSGRIVVVNPVAASLLGLEVPGVFGRQADRVLDQQRHGRMVGALHSALAGIAPAPRDVRLATATGDVVAVLRALPIFDADGRLDGALLGLRDVTDIRRAEDARRDFFANVSHELKTPIAAIRGLVETVLDDPEMPADERQSFLQRVQSQSMRLSALVTDVLALSRLESGDRPLDCEPVDLSDLARSIVASHATSADRAGVTLELDLPANGGPVIEAEAESLHQAVANLVSNAILHGADGSAGSRVAVRVLQRPGGAASIDVSDTGPGVREEDVDRIFERFYRADPARSRARGGTGLGLAIVKHVALAHGGDVSVDSQPDAGATFKLRLPAAPPPPS